MNVSLLELGSAAIATRSLQAAGWLLALGAGLSVGLPAWSARRARAPEAAAAAAPPTSPARRQAVLVRFGSALATVVVFWGAAYCGGAVFAAVMALLVGIGLAEFWGLARALGVAPLARLGHLAAWGVLASAAWFGPGAFAPALAASVGLVLAFALRGELAQLPARAGTTLLGVLYVGFLASYMYLLRQGPAGYGQFCLFFAVIQVADAFAFFGGRALGRHPLAPRLSPGKTWEGTAVGFASALATAWLFAFALPGWELWRVLLVGALLGLSSLLGDLVASGLKRAAGLKDFGTLLPEQGGLLDRFDGYLFSAPVAYYAFSLLGG